MVLPTPLLVFLELIVLRSVIADIRITEQPQNASVYRGLTHTLNCKFNELVNCTWQRNEIIVTIDLRYRYTKNNGFDTRQCSIEISNFTDIDASTWQCKNKAIQSLNVVNSEEAFLSIKLVEKVVIVLNREPISRLLVSDETQWSELLCVAKTTYVQNITLQWAQGGRAIANGKLSSNCSTDADSYCNTYLTWTGGWEPLANSKNLSCIAAAINLNSTVTLYRYDASNKSKIGFISILASGLALLLIVIVVSLVACYRVKCKCSGQDPDLFQSIEEIQHRCDSVHRIPQEALPRNPLINGGSYKVCQKASRGYLPLLEQSSSGSDPEAFTKAASYLELSQYQPYHACNCPCHLDLINIDYCSGNCNPHACSSQQMTYVRCPTPVDGCSAVRDLDSEELYSDGQSTADANGPKPSWSSPFNLNSAPMKFACHAPSCPDFSTADQHFSEESLYNDCIPVSSRPNQPQECQTPDE